MSRDIYIYVYTGSQKLYKKSSITQHLTQHLLHCENYSEQSTSCGFPVAPTIEAITRSYSHENKKVSHEILSY